MKVRDWAQFRVRMPPEFLAMLKLSAEKNHRSLNAEVLFALEEYTSKNLEATKASGQSPNRPDASTTTKQ